MRFATAALGCFIATFALARADDSHGRLDALLARVREAAGQPYRFHLRDRFAAADGDDVILTRESQGAKMRVSRCKGVICGGTYVDGADLWLTNLNDSAVPAAEGDDPRRVTLRAIENGAFAAPDFSTAGGSIALRTPLLLRDGRTVMRIAVTAPHGSTLDALIDDKTGLIAGARGLDIAVNYADERKVGDLTLPFEIDSGTTIAHFAERTVEPEPLDAPRGLVPVIAGERATAAFVVADRPSVDPVVECNLGGEHVACLLDSGNSGMSISLELAERLKLEPIAEAFHVRGIGAYETGVVKAPALHVGGATYPSAYYAVLHDVHGYGYDVVLGADAFAHARVTVDYPAHRLIVAPQSKEPPAGGVELTFENFLPVVAVQLGATKARLAVDTGDESAFNLSNDFYRAHPDIFKTETSAHVGGIGGGGEQAQGTIERVAIGDYILHHQAIGATDRSLPTADGHVGSGALVHFSATFDYAHRRLLLEGAAGDRDVSSGSSAAP